MSREVTTQTLRLNPCGQITGGSLTYTYHSSTGDLHYQGHILLKRIFFVRRKVFKGQLRLDPRSMLSERFKRGVIIHYRRLVIHVEAVADDRAHCTLDFAGAYPGVGLAVFNLEGPVVKLEWANGEGLLRWRSIFGRKTIYLDVIDGD